MVRTANMLWAAALVIGARGFLSSSAARRQRPAAPPLDMADNESADEALANMDNDSVIRSPLRFLGPYPTIPLKFPGLATPVGAGLDFELLLLSNSLTFECATSSRNGRTMLAELALTSYLIPQVGGFSSIVPCDSHARNDSINTLSSFCQQM